MAEGITWEEGTVSWEEVTRRVLLADCGECWPGSQQPCQVRTADLQRGGFYLIMKGTQEYVHQGRLSRAVRTGVIPSPDGITEGAWALHPLECGHWVLAKAAVRPGELLTCEACKESRTVISRLARHTERARVSSRTGAGAAPGRSR